MLYALLGEKQMRVIFSSDRQIVNGRLVLQCKAGKTYPLCKGAALFAINNGWAQEVTAEILEFKRVRYTTVRNYDGRWLVVDNFQFEVIEELDDMDSAIDYTAELNRRIAA